jgi:hypothetical protein
MIVTVRNQHWSREAFGFFFKGGGKRFEWLAIFIIRRLVEVGASMKTDNNRRRIQSPGLSESVT